MGQSLILVAEEHTEGVLLGMPTYWFAIIAGILFLLMFFITISFNGRGVIRSELGAQHLDADEQQALKEYQSKHSR